MMIMIIISTVISSVLLLLFSNFFLIIDPNGQCEPNEFQCNNKKCVLKTWRCDSDDDCGDGSDEANCATNPPGSLCAYHQFACHSNNQCIPRSYHCDMERDCVDGSDEVGCCKYDLLRDAEAIFQFFITVNKNF